MRMGSNLRSLFNNKVEPRRVTIEHEVDGMVPALDKDGNPKLDKDGSPVLKKGRVTESYSLFGMPDNHWVNLKAMEDHKLRGIGKLYSVHLAERGTIAEFTPEEVFQIMLVTHYIEAPFISEDGKPEVRGDSYSEVEIAIVAKEHGFLFGKLVGAANQIIQNLDDPEAGDPLLSVSMGNLPNPGAAILSAPASTPAAATTKPS